MDTYDEDMENIDEFVEFDDDEGIVLDEDEALLYAEAMVTQDSMYDYYVQEMNK